MEVAREDRIVAANDHLYEILGYQRQELLGTTIHDLTAPEDRATSDALNARLHEGLIDRIDWRNAIPRDGPSLWVHVTCPPFMTPRAAGNTPSAPSKTSANASGGGTREARVAASDSPLKERAEGSPWTRTAV